LNTLQFVGYGQLTLTELNFVSGPVISDLPEKEMVSYITSHPERFVKKNSVYVIRTRPLYWPGDILLKELRLLKKIGTKSFADLKETVKQFSSDEIQSLVSEKLGSQRPLFRHFWTALSCQDLVGEVVCQEFSFDL